MGVFEERPSHTPGMHWQQHEQYIGPAYDPSRDLSPNLPSCDSSMGDADPSVSSGSSCSTPSNNNHQPCSTDTCRLPPPSTTNHPHHHHHHHHHQHHHQQQQQQTPSSGDLCLPRPHSSYEHHIPKLEPSTETGTPSPQPISSDNDGCSTTTTIRTAMAMCAGCGHKITDRFYLQAVDRRWHATCLQCCQCRNTLDGEITCFSRDGNIYCKKDYYRLFGMKRCARCQATIISSELVMRARDLVFHVHCFSCAVCNSPLTKGDHFGMREGAVLCRLHFEMSPNDLPIPPIGIYTTPQNNNNNNNNNNNSNNNNNNNIQSHHYPPPFPSPEFHPHHHTQIPPPNSGIEPALGKVPFFNGAPTTPRQKGRPRKRKPKDLESMTANLDLNSDYLDMSFGRSPGTPGMHGSNQRTKRMRTSFKHHQLRTMKSYFAINHNPDAKDLKQLSQKTGLPKRVLQVWFQNARAKWRRMMLKQEGKSGDKCSGSESMSDLDLYPHGPGSMASSIQSMTPHSPPFILPPNSPSSLDCS